MRRPPKPFVTEYKPSTRRHPSPTGQAQPFADDGDLPAAKPNDAPRFDLTPRSDDSYEAAMRAADALFSVPSQAPAAAPAPRAAEPEAAPTRPQDRPAGRILQAIDETPAEPSFDFDDEPEPKRRGRKPGSKNKPKMPVTSIDPASISMFDLKAYDVAASRRPTVSEAPRTEEPAPSDEIVARPAAVNRAAASQRLPVRETEPFSWVRTQLAPGQAWKRRRLPKVCW